MNVANTTRYPSSHNCADGIRVHERLVTSSNENGRDIAAENRKIHFMKVTTEYFWITGLKMPRYSEKLKLLRNIMKSPIRVLSEAPERAPALFSIRNMMPLRLSSTPPDFCQLSGSFNTIAAMNIVYIGDIALMIEQCIGVTSGMAIRKVSCVTKYPRKAAANILR